MLARHLGTRVDVHSEGQVECGYYPIRPTPTGLAVCARWPDHVYQWHREGFELPTGSELLAEGDAFPAQAFRYGPCAYGIQFHPEVTHAMMCRWTTRGHERMGMPGAKQRAAHFEDRAVHDFAIRAWLSDFLDHWTGHAQADVRAAAGSREHTLAAVEAT
jgi:GMP synthase (glutamine-hydrolysing)